MFPHLRNATWLTGLLLLGLLGRQTARNLALTERPRPILAAVDGRARRPQARLAPGDADDVGGASVAGGRAQSPSLRGPGEPGPNLTDGVEAGNARRARTEHEFLVGFLGLERDRPGVLAACAPDVLAGEHTAAERVALLRALQESRSLEAVRWLEHAVRSLPDESGPHAESLPCFALGRLERLAAKDEAARAALARLAFEERALPLHLRRRAAAAFASACLEAELGSLRVRLAREQDELLVAGVHSALAARTANGVLLNPED